MLEFLYWTYLSLSDHDLVDESMQRRMELFFYTVCRLISLILKAVGRVLKSTKFIIRQIFEEKYFCNTVVMYVWWITMTFRPHTGIVKIC